MALSPSSVSTQKLLSALKGENKGRPPIWLMRQAGRYLPEYLALRGKYSLAELFFTPDLAAKVTLMPIERFSFDAAILFSDITVIASIFSLKLEFQEGPKITPLVTPSNFSQLTIDLEKVSSIGKTIEILKKELKVPLLGFCGAPFTVATYLTGGMEKALEWKRNKPVSFLQFLEKIEEATAQYINMQVEKGVDAFQIFDSWANVLKGFEFELYSFSFIKRLVSKIPIPTLFFMRNLAEKISLLKTVDVGLSLDWECSFSKIREQTNQSLQGNLDPDLLFSPLFEIKKKTLEILHEMKGDPSFIFNLGHGIKPKTPLDAVQTLVETVFSYE